MMNIENTLNKGTNILNYSSGSVTILDVYSLKPQFIYNAVSGQEIHAARWTDSHLYILCSGGTLKQFDLNTKKQTTQKMRLRLFSNFVFLKACMTTTYKEKGSI